MNDGPLDMRMDKDAPLTAEEIVNEYDSEQLLQIIRDYGEERWAKRIIEFIVEARQEKRITTTGELVRIIKNAIPAKARQDGPHPAKRTFQAIRIEVNRELAKNKAIEPSIGEIEVNPRARSAKLRVAVKL